MKNPTPANPVMTDNILFEHFATLATAPDGIARLRELILQLAVQGKLGTQDAGDEPASVAVDVFFRKNKHIKKKHFVNIDENSRLPDRWISITLGDIGQWALGTGFPISIQGHTDKPILFCKVSDMNLPGNEKWIKTTNHTIDEEIKNQYNIKTHSKGTVIFPKIGGAIATNKRRIITRSTAIDNNCLGITPNDFCSTDWLFSILTSIDFTQYQSGTSMPALNQGTLAEIVTSLPPLAEQHRIVAKVNRLMALCDDLEARQKHERAGCLKLGTASLAGLQNAESPEEFGRQWAQVCDAFDLILDCPENVAVLRQTILQLAVQGRLVKQELGDEPASSLVKKMGESDKDVLSLSDIPPFNLPDSWEWITFEMILKDRKLLSYGILMPGAYDPSGIPMVRVMDIGEKTLNNTNIFRVSQDLASQYERTKIEAGDILLAVMATVGRAIVAPPELNNANVNRALAVIKIHPTVDSQYLCYVIRSPLIQNLFLQEKIGSAQPRINLRKLRQFPVPLPPLAEQHRIVAKVDALMTLCDALESRLKERAGVQGKFANAVVKQVAG